jgi:hypothetical protein
MSELFRLGQDLWSFLPLPSLGAPSEHDLYLSPHLDDVCFSLGSYVASRGKGTLLNIFTHSNCIRHHDTIGDQRLDELSPGARSMLVTTIRRDEDERFAVEVGLCTSYCNLDEAPVRGREPFDPACVHEDTNQFSAAIMDFIRTLRLDGGERNTVLYCPLGIGGHVDHLVVRNTVLKNLVELQALYKVCFYEDLPYAAHPADRQTGLRDFFERISPVKPWRHALRVRNLSYKRELLEIYKSQFRWLPAVIQEFSSATKVPRNPVHEALWVL